ncbi:unnamed protein product [Bemisia tabaci]|uniref:Uncharacterized protein n=1 Tax=Bemisia tabaci TaxID=7038 RepID=A0A9P0AF52_BEMTA|nr:unnamed protein product [Bemisia tabaci]
MDSNCELSPCSVHPSVLFLLLTLVLTSCSTSMLSLAIMTHHWEHVRWDAGLVDLVAENRSASGLQVSVERYIDGLVTKVSARGLHHRRPLLHLRHAGDTTASVFLVPMNGGIWTLCISLTEEQLRLLETVGFSHDGCTNYLSQELIKGDEIKADWQHRMQNLSISCALVCLIILGCSALVGAFGILKHQISAVLVTGVMYLLAATFALFTLTIIHFKREQVKTRSECLSGGGAGVGPPGSTGAAALLGDGVVAGAGPVLEPGYARVWADLHRARLLSHGWSLDLGWAGLALCVLTSVLWILLSKIMRYNPINAT